METMVQTVWKQSRYRLLEEDVKSSIFCIAIVVMVVGFQHRDFSTVLSTAIKLPKHLEISRIVF